MLVVWCPSVKLTCRYSPKLFVSHRLYMSCNTYELNIFMCTWMVLEWNRDDKIVVQWALWCCCFVCRETLCSGKFKTIETRDRTALPVQTAFAELRTLAFWFSIFGCESVRCVTIMLSAKESKTHSVQGTGSLITLQEL